MSKNVFHDFNNVLAVYPYGSRVYGTATKNSDYDYVVLIKKKTQEQYSDSLININFYTPEEHQRRLNEHEISALECYFLPQHMVLFDSVHPLNRHNPGYNFELNLSVLRKSISAKSSNSWVKAKKKLTVKKDYDLNLGRKSLFHAIRIIEFGIQIAEYGKIVDYGSSNLLFHEINNSYDWAELYNRFKKLYNEKLSQFRIVAPKQINV